METSASVGLVVLVDVPSIGGRAAVLRVRGEFDQEMKPDIHKGYCQITAYRKYTNGNTFNALQQIIENELGGSAALFLNNVHNQGSGFAPFSFKKEKETMVVYGVNLSSSDSITFLGTIRLKFITGGLRFVRHDDLNSIVGVSNEETSLLSYEDVIRRALLDVEKKDLATTTVMFLDDIEILKNVFKYYLSQ